MLDNAREIVRKVTGRPARETCNQKVELNPDCHNKWIIRFKYIRFSDNTMVEAHSDREEDITKALQTVLNIVDVARGAGIITKWAVYVVPQVHYTSPIAKLSKWCSRGSRFAWDSKHETFIELCKTFGVRTMAA